MREYIKGRTKAEWQRQNRKPEKRIELICEICNEKRIVVIRQKDKTICKHCHIRTLSPIYKAKNGHTAGWTGSKYISGSYIAEVKRNARTRGITYDIPLEEIDRLWDAQNGRCALTGRAMTHDRNDHCKRSLDRIDSSRGYIAGNIQWVCTKINKLKNNMPDGEFIQICKEVAANSMPK
jgi:hypothetical protein